MLRSTVGVTWMLGVLALGLAQKSAASEPSGIYARLYWDRAIQRAEREELLWLYLEDHTGSEPPVNITLHLPEGLKTLDAPTVAQAIWEHGVVFTRLQNKPVRKEEPYPTMRICWRVIADGPLIDMAKVDINAGDTAAFTAEAQVNMTAPLETRMTEYVGEPQVADSGGCLVGMHYCPLWKPGTHREWHMLERNYPWRKPALGWYDESDPEVTDWEIKYAVEHGIDFFLYCWYRGFGNEGKPVTQRLSHAIHDGLFHARYGNHIKFAIMWCDGPYSGCAGRDDMMNNLLPFWLESYFGRENYLKIDGKPVLFIYDIDRLVKDFGSESDVRTTMNEMREVCAARDFGGLVILAESRQWIPDRIRRMAACGLDASFAYCWNGIPDGADEETARDFIMKRHRERAEWDILPNVPTVSAMWDPEPWERFSGNRVSPHYRLDPPAFKTLCRQIRSFMQNLPEGNLGRRVLLVDNWNEWSEGHYLAPCREHGFAYLDAFRDVFTSAEPEHIDVLPEEVGRGPYEAAYNEWLKAQRER